MCIQFATVCRTTREGIDPTRHVTRRGRDRRHTPTTDIHPSRIRSSASASNDAVDSDRVVVGVGVGVGVGVAPLDDDGRASRALDDRWVHRGEW
jgi:hypothetical protein